MFKTLKNALGLGKSQSHEAAHPSSHLPSVGSEIVASASSSAISEWAGLQGLNYSGREGRSHVMEGEIGGKPWKMEQGKASRDFIKGLELRARGQMGLQEDIAVMVMSRQLKNELEKRAFSLYTDSLQTQVDPNLPEEMRWLSMYQEVGWPELGQAFFDQYAILSDERDHAIAWLTSELTQQLLSWPGDPTDLPRVLMLLRGKVYLRMQISEEDLPALDHASRVFTLACEAGLAAFSKSD